MAIAVFFYSFKSLINLFIYSRSVYLKVENVAEGEARRYFDHAVVLKNTILFLRNNKDLSSEEENGNIFGLGMFVLTLTRWFCL